MCYYETKYRRGFEPVIKRNSFILLLAVFLVLLSGALYFVHYLLFRDIHHIFLYLVGELAFLPLEVLLVVLIVERFLTRREQNVKLQKLNMVLGAFFSEIGYYLLNTLLENFRNRQEISGHLNITAAWTKRDFQKAVDYASNLPIEVDSNSLDLVRLKEFLSKRREFLLTLLENPSLLEHDRFTELLWAVTHLDEELEARQFPDKLPAKDLEHIAGDIRRMYDHLASEWLDYAEHLKINYPYLFSLILRTHPFQEHPSPIVD
jgi:hypothetical protein